MCMHSPPKPVTALMTGSENRFTAIVQPLVTSRMQTAAVRKFSLSGKERIISEIPEKTQTNPQTVSIPDELEATLSTTAFEKEREGVVSVIKGSSLSGRKEQINPRIIEAIQPLKKMIFPASLEPSIALPRAFIAKPAPELMQKRSSLSAWDGESLPEESIAFAVFAPTGYPPTMPRKITVTASGGKEKSFFIGFLSSFLRKSGKSPKAASEEATINGKREGIIMFEQ